MGRGKADWREEEIIRALQVWRDCNVWYRTWRSPQRADAATAFARVADANRILADAFKERHGEEYGFPDLLPATEKPLIYLASPFTHPDKDVERERFEAVAKCAARLMGEGELVFCPVTHSYPMHVLGGLCGTFEFWREWNLTILRRCDVLRVLQLDGWIESRGVRGEIEEAQLRGMPIQYLEAT